MDEIVRASQLMPFCGRLAHDAPYVRSRLRLLSDQLAQKLIEMYDKNGDGVLQPSEFAPRSDLKARLDALFAERNEV